MELRLNCELTRQLSSVENPGWLVDIGDGTTQLHPRSLT